MAISNASSAFMVIQFLSNMCTTSLNSSRLTLEFLKDLAVSVYQINLDFSYIQDKNFGLLTYQLQ